MRRRGREFASCPEKRKIFAQTLHEIALTNEPSRHIQCLAWCIAFLTIARCPFVYRFTAVAREMMRFTYKIRKIVAAMPNPKMIHCKEPTLADPAPMLCRANQPMQT